jgi:hypothetical protein
MLLPGSAHAGTILRSGETVSVESEQTLKGDFYGFGSSISISGSAENDVYLGGGTVVINAPIQQDLAVVGGSVQVHGDVNDDIRVVAGDVTIAKHVKGDVVVLGGTLTILSTATIEGDILFMGGDLNIEGEVVGTVHGTAKNVRINAKVGGDVSLTVTDAFTLGDNAEIIGDVTYTSQNNLVRAQNAVISGQPQKIEVQKETQYELFRTYLFFIFTILFASLSLYFVFRTQIRVMAEQQKYSVGVLGLSGIATLLIVPFVSVVLLASVLGMLVGVALLMSYVLAIIFAFILAGIMFGNLIQYVLYKDRVVTFITVIVGVIGFLMLGLIPYIGGIFIFAGIIIALGQLCVALLDGLRQK